jgi:hypothetical protein
MCSATAGIIFEGPFTFENRMNTFVMVHQTVEITRILSGSKKTLFIAPKAVNWQTTSKLFNINHGVCGQ